MILFNSLPYSLIEKKIPSPGFVSFTDDGINFYKEAPYFIQLFFNS